MIRSNIKRLSLACFVAVFVILGSLVIYERGWYLREVDEGINWKAKGSEDKAFSSFVPGTPALSSNDEYLVQVSKVRSNNTLVLFPRTFPLSDKSDLEKYYTDILGEKFPDAYDIVKYQYKFVDTPVDLGDRKEVVKKEDSKPKSAVYHKSEPLTSHIKGLDYKSQTFETFHSQRTIKGDFEQCDKLAQDIKVEVSSGTMLGANMTKVVEKFYKEQSPYYLELEDVFKPNPIEKQLEEGTIDEYWFRLAGSSVYLEQYGVHYLISRVVYSPVKKRNYPSISLTYAQIYDENWNEIEGIELILPTNNADLGVYSQQDEQFRVARFPDFLKIPFYHNYNLNPKGYYGPEDPRILLVTNPRGHQEPLIVFNAYHRKVESEEYHGQHDMDVKFKYYRSIFMCWPWQFQRGKLNTDDLKSSHSDNIYQRALELRRTNVPRLETQKNWTPFVLYQDRQELQYDKYLYIVYRWSKLEILRCNLADNSGLTSNCEFIYQLDKSTPPESAVGVLRGGTHMTSINEMLDDYKSKYPQLQLIIDKLPVGREIWIGFARAHMVSCGCAGHFYRPNVVVMTRDKALGYKITLISSFVAFGVPVPSWELSRNDELCYPGENNVMIPNGVSAWSLSTATDSEGKPVIQDQLALTYSISDVTIELLHIRGLINSLITSDYDNESHEFKIFQGNSTDVGYNDENVDCALRSSIKYCEAYGKSHHLN